jgi:DNA-directed RNA polymerase specialized sigma24 family protein
MRVHRIGPGCLRQLSARWPGSNAATDIDLVAAAAEGNRHAFAALVSHYQAPIISFARSCTGNDEDAEDLAQEVFVRVYRALR